MLATDWIPDPGAWPHAGPWKCLLVFIGLGLAWLWAHRTKVWQAEWAIDAAIGAVVLVGVWTWLDPELWQATTVVLLALLIRVAPSGRRTLIGVPLVIAVIGTMTFIGIGRTETETSNADAKKEATEGRAKDYAAACTLATSYADLGLVDATRRQLERATAMQPEETPTADACTEASARLIELDPTSAAQPAALPEAAGPASTSSKGLSLLDAFKLGVEHTLAPVLEPDIPADKGGVALTWGPHGWLLLGAILLILLILWTNVGFWMIRRNNPPTITLAKVEAGDKTREDMAIGFAAQVRKQLFDEDLSTPTGSSKTSDELAGVVTESGVSGAALIVAVTKVLTIVFSTSNTVTATITLLDEAVILEVSDGRTGRTLSLRQIPWHEDDEPRVIRAIAANLRRVALNRPGNRLLPPWLEWTDDAMEDVMALDAGEGIMTTTPDEPAKDQGPVSRAGKKALATILKASSTALSALEKATGAEPETPTPPTPEERVAASITKLRLAHSVSPANVTIVMRLGGLYEHSDEVQDLAKVQTPKEVDAARAQEDRAGKATTGADEAEDRPKDGFGYLAAVRLYLKHANEWNRLYEVRYRLAATLGMSDRSMVHIATSSLPRRATTQQAMQARADLKRWRYRYRQYAQAAAAIADPSVEDLNAALLAAAAIEWANLERDMSVICVAGRCLSAMVLPGDQYRDASYQRALLRPRNRAVLIPSIQAARLVTNIQQLAPWPTPLPPTTTEGLYDPIRGKAERRLRVEAIRQGRQRNLAPEALYALACAYSRLWEIEGNPHYAQQAVDNLKRLVARESLDRWMMQINDDPDLVPILITNEYRAWQAELNPTAVPWDQARWLRTAAHEAEKYWTLVAELMKATSLPQAAGPTAESERAQWLRKAWRRFTRLKIQNQAIARTNAAKAKEKRTETRRAAARAADDRLFETTCRMILPLVGAAFDEAADTLRADACALAIRIGPAPDAGKGTTWTDAQATSDDLMKFGQDRWIDQHTLAARLLGPGKKAPRTPAERAALRAARWTLVAAKLAALTPEENARAEDAGRST